MTQLSIWFERKFKFDFPVELWPNLLARLRGAPVRLEELVEGISEEVLTAKPEGKWSIQESAGHLVDLEPLWMSRVVDFLKGVETLTAADLTNRRTEEAGHNEENLADILAEFRRLRTAKMAELEKLRPEDFVRTALHPRLKQPMRFVDHLFFVAEHDDHHLARIWELKQAGRK